MTGNGWCLEWASGDGAETGLRFVQDADDLDEALDEINLVAILESQVIQVDMWPTARSSGDPVLIQFLVGDPTSDQHIS